MTREPRHPLPARPGQPAGDDAESKREGTAHGFLFVQPWRGWRHVNVTPQRTKPACAQQMRLLVDDYCPTAERLRRVVDNLKTHTPAAWYSVFPPPEARRITRQLALHYTPKQGRGLNRAAWELAVLAGPCLARRIPNIDTWRAELAAWQGPRHQCQTKIHWPFSTDVARTKLKRLYPAVEPTEALAKPKEAS